MRASLLTTVLLASAALYAQNLAVSADPAVDPHFPAAMHEVAVPSHGSQLLGVLYTAAGKYPHPTVILYHGFPGYEQNLDLAQALRRDGYNVLAVHYRGSWGVQGNFSFTGAMQDADAQVDWIKSPAVAATYHVDPARIILIGHSMGGYMAASAAAHHPEVKAVVMISAWAISRHYAGLKADEKSKAEAIFLDKFDAADLLPLAGTTPSALATEIFEHRNDFDFVSLAPALANRPVLLITANDGSGPDSEALLQALKHAGDMQASQIKMATDHPFSDHRIALENTVLNWLAPRVATTPPQH